MKADDRRWAEGTLPPMVTLERYGITLAQRDAYRAGLETALRLLAPKEYMTAQQQQVLKGLRALLVENEDAEEGL